MKEKKHYLTSEEIYQQWKIWRDTGAITDTLALQLQKIATGLAASPRFNKYQPELIEDLVSSAVLKCLKNLKNVKEEKKDKLFNYFTLCSQCAFLTVLGKHYRHLNLIRMLKERELGADSDNEEV